MSAYSDLILATPGIQAYYRLGEASGTTVVDATGNGRDLTSSAVTLGTTGLLTGDADTAYTFNGSTSVCELDNTTPIDFATNDAMSAEAWIRIPSPRNTYDWWLSMGVDATYTHVFGSVDTGQVYWRMVGTDRNAVTATINGNTVYHVVITGGLETGTVTTRIYLNGEFIESASEGVASMSSIDHIAIGATPGIGNVEFNGIIDEVAIYNVVLTPEQIAAHYDLGVNGPPAEPEPEPEPEIIVPWSSGGMGMPRSSKKPPKKREILNIVWEPENDRMRR
jgi:hypothetical protein